MKKIIVAGIDASENASRVINATRLMADRMDANVVLVGAVEGTMALGMLPSEIAPDATLWQAATKKARENVAAAAERFRHGVVVEQRVETESAWRLLLDSAKKHQASLIIVGAHSYRPLDRFLGTTASKVANRAECSVLIARKSLGFERVAVALDASERQKSVLAAAMACSRPSSGRLILTHVVTPPDVLASLAPVDVLVKESKDVLEKMRGALPDDVPAETQAREGIPSDVVLDIAKEKDATLLVIGSHGFEGWDHMLGTTAGRIVNNADRSVLVVRGNPFS